MSRGAKQLFLEYFFTESLYKYYLGLYNETIKLGECRGLGWCMGASLDGCFMYSAATTVKVGKTMFSERLREARKAKHYSQAEVSRLLGVTQQAVGKWETGRSTPDPQTVARLAEILDTTADMLLGLQSNADAHGAVGQRAFSQYTQCPIPVVGTVRAGYDALAFEEDYGTEYASVKDPQNYFYLVVKGDSMEPRISDGDLALIHRQNTLDNGDLGVMVYGDGNGTLKKYIQRVSLLPKRVRNTVPPEAMLEGVLCYYGGFDLDAVRKMLGCTQDMASATVRCRVYDWRQEHPALAAGMPPKRPKPKEGVKSMKMTIDKKGLPAYAYARSRYTNNIVRVVRGERALFGVVSQDCVDALNNAAGVTRAQAAAMYGGAMYGWNSPMADPKNYSDTGSYIGPEMENANGEE